MTKNSRIAEVRSAAILTNSYVEGTIIDEANQYNQLSLEIAYTKGSLTSLEIKIEYSQDGVTYVQDANVAPSAGTNTISVSEYTYAGSTANFILDMPINTNFIKVSAKGTGTVTSSSLAINAVLAYV